MLNIYYTFLGLTCSILINEKLNENNFKIIYNQSVLVDLYKHKLYQIMNNIPTRYKQNVNISTLVMSKSF